MPAAFTAGLSTRFPLALLPSYLGYPATKGTGLPGSIEQGGLLATWTLGERLSSRDGSFFPSSAPRSITYLLSPRRLALHVSLSSGAAPLAAAPLRPRYPPHTARARGDYYGTDGTSSKMEAGVAGDDGSRETRKEFSCPPSPNCIFSLRERCIASVTKKLRPGWKIQRRNSKDNVANYCTSQMRSADKGRGKINYPPSDSKYKAINGLIRIRCVSVGTKR